MIVNCKLIELSEYVTTKQQWEPLPLAGNTLLPRPQVGP